MNRQEGGGRWTSSRDTNVKIKKKKEKVGQIDGEMDK